MRLEATRHGKASLAIFAKLRRSLPAKLANQTISAPERPDRQTLKPEENKAPRATHRFWIDLAQLLLSNLHSMVCYSYFLPISRTATA
ncbi:MAG TPA: hypothetical protein DD672_10120 [Gammaproteobacteria bacterium]|nr:hypothetical protein [Gammaproteobacteria bacterium]OUX35343.1 MAG: hypothetical protein CBE20_00090 [Gammaproteobacteria bacterium TMED260]HBQ00819.1 hypothetical protein [Gammaproteobacteria bacterium]HCA35330.1 hypothetical protein [Gammaproteobacteria bacterium]